MSELTRDALLGGELTFWQPARGRGYRFNLDPVLLADFAPRAPHIVDFGAGCGVIGLLLLALGKAERVTAVERQSDLADLARRNAVENGLSSRFAVVDGDLRQVELPRADGAVFNPPYFKLGEGRPPPDRGRGAGRHELYGTLADFVDRALGVVDRGGPISLILKQQRAAELRRIVADHGASVVRSRAVVSREAESPRGAMIELGAVSRAAEIIERPLVVHAGVDREYSDEVRAMLRE